MKTVIKLLSALAAVAGVVYIIATYGEQITAWAKKVLSNLPKCPCCKDDAAEEAPAEAPVAEEAPAEEPAAVEVPVEAPVAAPVEEPVVAPHEPVAEDADFAE